MPAHVSNSDKVLLLTMFAVSFCVDDKIPCTIRTMIVTPLPQNGNSSKFQVVTKRGEFTIALSYTLRTKIWQFADDHAELSAAKELAEAIVSRHDPTLPFRTLYIFAEHNSDPSFLKAIQKIRKYGIGG